MRTECSTEQFEFGHVEGHKVVASFDGGAITSDVGGLLLGATDRVIGLVERFAACFRDDRRAELIEHSVATLVGQRVHGIALGYEDLIDHDTLRHDPVLAVLAGKLKAGREDCAAVAGKSTLNRLELSKGEPSRYHKISYDGEAIETLFVDLLSRHTSRRPSRSPLISMPRTIRCTVSRKAASSTVTTNAIATCRCIFFAGGIFCAPSCAGPTSMPVRARSRKWRGSLSRYAGAGRMCTFCCGRIRGLPARR